MEIVLAIDEADIGQVREGLPVRFTVDAFPDASFRGRVRQVRLAATNTANVITYPVVVDVDNPEQTLLPGMTANAEIEISRKADVLSVPNAALRFRPAEDSPAAVGGGRGGFGGVPANPNRASGNGAPRAGQGGAGMQESFAKIAAKLQLDASQQAAFDQSLQTMRERMQQMRGAGGPAAGGGGPQAGAGGGQRAGGGSGDRGRRMAERMKQGFAGFRATLRPEQAATWDAELAALTSGKRAPVYKLVDGKPEQVTVRIGATDGTRTEIVGDGLAEGDQVIVGSARPAAP
jgi:HlyD family secretion protein